MEFCPKCGEKMRAVSIGWLCPKCKCFADTNGDVLVYEDKPFMPKPTNGDLLRSMSDEELAAWICLPDADAERYETCITITTEKTFDIPYDKQTDPLNDVLSWLRQEAEM